MAEQVRPGTMTGLAETDARLSPASASGPAHTSHHGRPVSWVAVSLVMAGFLAGGIGLMIGPRWWLFWAGAGVAVVGGLIAMATDIFEDWY